MKPTDEQLANREAWLTALRGGEYEQGQDALCKDGKYCCLGVDAELAGILRVRATEPAIKLTPCGKSGYPDARWFEERHGISAGMMYTLSGWNDIGVPFTEIADRLEAFFTQADAGQLEVQEFPSG